MPTNPLTHNPIRPGTDGPPLLGLPASTPAAAETPTFPAPGKRTAKALSELEKVEEQHARWLAAGVAKNAELVDLERHVGEEILAAADGDADRVATRLSRQVLELRAAVDTAGRAAQAAERKITEARRAVLRAEAEDLQDVLADARRDQAKHDGKLAELLRAVSDHDAAEYRPFVPATSHGSIAMEPAGPYVVSRSALLRERVSELVLMLEIATAAASGESLPMFKGGVPIPGRFYSSRVRGPLAYFPELVG